MRVSKHFVSTGRKFRFDIVRYIAERKDRLVVISFVSMKLSQFSIVNAYRKIVINSLYFVCFTFFIISYVIIK